MTTFYKIFKAKISCLLNEKKCSGMVEIREELYLVRDENLLPEGNLLLHHEACRLLDYIRQAGF
jgi:hypothetical protein